MRISINPTGGAFQVPPEEDHHPEALHDGDARAKEQSPATGGPPLVGARSLVDLAPTGRLHEVAGRLGADAEKLAMRGDVLQGIPDATVSAGATVTQASVSQGNIDTKSHLRSENPACCGHSKIDVYGGGAGAAASFVAWIHRTWN